MPHSSGTPEPSLYRRMIDWKRRLGREGPLLLQQLRLQAGARVLDLGCGTGEHDRWLAAQGMDVVGVDASPEMVATAREAAVAEPQIQVLEAPIQALPEEVKGPFDAAFCLGNTLVHLQQAEALEACFAGVAKRLSAGGRLLIQILNYTAVLGQKRRMLPVNFRPGDEGAELAFLRFMDPREPGFVEFESVVLERRAGEPSKLLASRGSLLRAWKQEDLVPRLEQAVGPVSVFGSLEGAAFDPDTSNDLVLLAERSVPS